MKAKSLDSFNMGIAPDEWAEIPEIKEGKPKGYTGEKRLYKIEGHNICRWYINFSGRWLSASEYFYITK
jgi:hypothetical protein